MAHKKFNRKHPRRADGRFKAKKDTKKERNRKARARRR